jgi:hypothetical protein
VFEPLDVVAGAAPVVVVEASSVSSPVCPDDVSLSSLSRSSLEPSVSSAADPEGEACAAVDDVLEPEVFEPLGVAAGAAPVVVADGSEESSSVCSDDVSPSSLSRASPAPSEEASPESSEGAPVWLGAAALEVVLALGVVTPVSSSDSGSVVADVSVGSEAPMAVDLVGFDEPAPVALAVFAEPVDSESVASSDESLPSESVASAEPVAIGLVASTIPVDSEEAPAAVDLVGFKEPAAVDLAVFVELVASGSAALSDGSVASGSVASDEPVAAGTVVSGKSSESTAPVCSDKRPVEVGETFAVPLSAPDVVGNFPFSLKVPVMAAVPTEDRAVCMRVPLTALVAVGSLPVSLSVPVEMRDLAVPSSESVASVEMALLVLVDMPDSVALRPTRLEVVPKRLVVSVATDEVLWDESPVVLGIRVAAVSSASASVEMALET